jgi:hypothetical protein
MWVGRPALPRTAPPRQHRPRPYRRAACRSASARALRQPPATHATHGQLILRPQAVAAFVSRVAACRSVAAVELVVMLSGNGTMRQASTWAWQSWATDGAAGSTPRAALTATPVPTLSPPRLSHCAPSAVPTPPTSRVRVCGAGMVVPMLDMHDREAHALNRLASVARGAVLVALRSDGPGVEGLLAPLPGGGPECLWLQRIVTLYHRIPQVTQAAGWRPPRDATRSTRGLHGARLRAWRAPGPGVRGFTAQPSPELCVARRRRAAAQPRSMCEAPLPLSSRCPAVLDGGWVPRHTAHLVWQ